jgi:hypothetical protein
VAAGEDCAVRGKRVAQFFRQVNGLHP